MKFQNPSIHRPKVSNFTEQWKNQSKFQNFVLSKFDKKQSKLKQVIYSSSLTIIPNMKIFKFCFQRDITQKKGHNLDMKKKNNTGQLLFHAESVCEISKP